MKVLVFLPDGVGLRNFAFTKFYDIGKRKDDEVVFWNNTNFPLKDDLGVKEIPVLNSKSNPLSDIYKRAKTLAELKLNYKKTKDKAYLTYIFPHSYKGLKKGLKSLFVDFLVTFNTSEKGVEKLREKIFASERKTAYYKSAIDQLKKETPDFIFCTNQRPILAVAPLLAAKDLGIPTASFIFSWDNLPKATLIVETDYYFVWSVYMKEELLKYYPHISKDQIKVTGTPQFEPHFDTSILESRSQFCDMHNLDETKKYICFSGDDVTTSPNDEFYLKDVAQTVQELNNDGHNIGVIFRKCPVDFTGRYNSIIEDYNNVIIPIDPLWEKKGEGWNTIMPTKADLALLANTSKHCELVINVGSSTVFDFAIHDNACAYLNYKTEKVNNDIWNTKTIYNFIHFRSKPSEEAVLWINSKADIKEVVLKALDSDLKIDVTKEWFKTINIENPTKASENIWEEINNIV